MRVFEVSIPVWFLLTHSRENCNWDSSSVCLSVCLSVRPYADAFPHAVLLSRASREFCADSFLFVSCLLTKKTWMWLRLLMVQARASAPHCWSRRGTVSHQPLWKCHPPPTGANDRSYRWGMSTGKSPGGRGLLAGDAASAAPFSADGMVKIKLQLPAITCVLGRKDLNEACEWENLERQYLQRSKVSAAVFFHWELA